jgi:hypothetical protein
MPKKQIQDPSLRKAEVQDDSRALMGGCLREGCGRRDRRERCEAPKRSGACSSLTARLCERARHSSLVLSAAK